MTLRGVRPAGRSLGGGAPPLFHCPHRFEEATYVRVLSYNVLGFQGWPERMMPKVPLTDETGAANLGFWVDLLRGLDCDIICLQEVDTVERMKHLASALDRYLAPFPSPTRYAGCVLSTSPIVETRLFNECGPRGRTGLFSRFGGAALLEIGEERVWVVNLHLNPHDIEMRSAEGDLLARHLDTLLIVEPKAMVMGDFNCRVDEQIHGLLRDRGFVNAMERAGGGLQPTEWQGVKAIDHIYVSAALAGRLVAAQVVTGPGFTQDEDHPWSYSDHLPVVAELAW